MTTIARRWGVDPPNPVPVYLTDYLLVFPESDPRLGEEWVHLKAGDSGFPTLDLDFVQLLVTELTTPCVRNCVGDLSDRDCGSGSAVRGWLLQWRRHGMAVAQLQPVGGIPRLRRRRHGVGSGEGPALSVRVGQRRCPARAGAGRLHPGHRRPRLPPDVHAAGNGAGPDAARVHRDGDAGAQRHSHGPRRPQRDWCPGALASPRWSCSSSRERRRS